MVDFNKISRAQEVDASKNVVQGGTTLEIKILTCTVSSMQAMNFSEIPKAVMFQTRTAATDVEFSLTSTTPNAAGGEYWTVKGGGTLSLDLAKTGTFYFRNSAANQDSIVIGLALL